MRKPAAALAALLFPTALAAAPLPMPSDWQTVYAVFLERADDGPALSDDAHRVLRMMHVQYQLRLQADGKAAAAGGFANGDGAIGMLLLCADGVEAATALANADPAVQFGQMRARVRAWQVPAGRIACMPRP
jgi:uncharacterized protein YciI